MSIYSEKIITVGRPQGKCKDSQPGAGGREIIQRPHAITFRSGPLGPPTHPPPPKNPAASNRARGGLNLTTTTTTVCALCQFVYAYLAAVAACAVAVSCSACSVRPSNKHVMFFAELLLTALAPVTAAGNASGLVVEI